MILKNNINRFLEDYQNIKNEDIINLLEAYEYISFDIFDTLIKRVVKNPEDIFELVSRKAEIVQKSSFSDFYIKRTDAEKKARINKKNSNNNKEITLAEIYEYIEGYNVEQKAILMDLECEAEEIYCTENNDIIEIYKWCVKKNKKIIIVSDMYLPEKCIRNILKNNGITVYEALYLSSKERKTKQSGELFEYVLSQHKITSEKIVHIGDAYTGDFKNAKNKGIFSIKISHNVKKSKWRNLKNSKSVGDFEYQCLDRMIDVTCSKNEKEEYLEYKQFGYELFGILLWGFSKWLFEELKKNDIKKVYFLSRDGYSMKKAFDKINDNTIESYYLYASRRSLRIPQLWQQPEFKYAFEGLLEQVYFPIDSIFRNVGLDAKLYEELIVKYGFDRETQYTKRQLESSKSFNEMYQCIKNDIIENSKKEFDALIKYLEQEKFSGRIAIVDIGWSGRMQKNLIRSLTSAGVSFDIYGFYTALLAEGRNNQREYSMKMKGYLFDLINNNINISKEGPFLGLYETMFLAQEGSTKKYQIKSDGTVSPVLYEYEYMDENGYMPEAYYVKSIQQGALEFIDEVKKYPLFDSFVLSPAMIFLDFFNMGMKPNKNALKLFGEFRFMDNGISYLAKPKSLGYYIINPRVLWHDFMNSSWKSGFFKKLFKNNIVYPGLLYYFQEKFEKKK